jgi:hypothetical protein
MRRPYVPRQSPVISCSFGIYNIFDGEHGVIMFGLLLLFQSCPEVGSGRFGLSLCFFQPLALVPHFNGWWLGQIQVPLVA